MITEMLKNKVAVVTGGTRGIGYAVVRKFLEQGAKVVLFGSRQETADKAVELLKKENADWNVSGMAPKISDETEVKAAMDEIVQHFGRIDILVNNAGISAREPLAEYSVEEFDKIMDLNVKAIFVCSKAVESHMREQGEGCIINTSSMVSLYGQASGCGYPASKFAVNGLTKSLARELGKSGIRVNAVAPGVVRTDMLANLPEYMVKQVSENIPLQRPAEPEEVADAFLFLASSMANYVSGAVLSVDGAIVN